MKCIFCKFASLQAHVDQNQWCVLAVLFSDGIDDPELQEDITGASATADQLAIYGVAEIGLVIFCVPTEVTLINLHEARRCSSRCTEPEL